MLSGLRFSGNMFDDVLCPWAFPAEEGSMEFYDTLHHPYEENKLINDIRIYSSTISLQPPLYDQVLFTSKDREPNLVITEPN